MTTPSLAVVVAVADVSNVEPKSLEPLHRFIDPDALDDLVDSTSDGTDDPELTVRFEYLGYEVTVHDGGTIELDGREVDVRR